MAMSESSSGTVGGKKRKARTFKEQHAQKAKRRAVNRRLEIIKTKMEEILTLDPALSCAFLVYNSDTEKIRKSYTSDFAELLAHDYTKQLLGTVTCTGDFEWIDKGPLTRSRARHNDDDDDESSGGDEGGGDDGNEL